MPVALRSMAKVCDHSIAGTVGSNLTKVMDVCLLLLLYVMLVAVSTTSWITRAQDCHWVCVCDLETSTMPRPRPKLDC
jgi:hypothetical protein